MNPLGIPGVPSGLSHPSLEETYSSLTADPAYKDQIERLRINELNPKEGQSRKVFFP